jgi:hypothetical protein
MLVKTTSTKERNPKKETLVKNNRSMGHTQMIRSLILLTMKTYITTNAIAKWGTKHVHQDFFSQWLQASNHPH